MIDNDTMAATNFYQRVRDFAVSVKPWEQAIWYDTKPDEVRDPTLVSQRVYGNRDEFLTVMASAGLNALDAPLTQRRLALPTAERLHQMKRESGFESIEELRDGFTPIWAD